MASARSGSTGRGALRTVALVLAVLVALGSTATVVISDDPQTLRLAVVGALWAFVLAAFAAPRRRSGEPAAGSAPGTELELRRTYEIELEREVAARREYELQLEVYLRRELERGLAEDVAALRDEVGRMRGEMMDRLDGELRMERIETTRLVGGSLRALQDQARRLGIDVPVPAELSSADVLEAPGYGPGYADPPAAPPAAAPPPQWGEPQWGEPRWGPPAAAPPTGLPTGLPTGPPSGPPSGPPTGSPSGPPTYGAPTSGPPAYGAPVYEAPAGGSSAAAYSPYPTYAEPDPLHDPLPRPYSPPPPPPPPPPAYPPAPRPPAAGESVPPRRRRARDDGEDNEVMSRLLGR